MALPGATAGQLTSQEAAVLDHWSAGYTNVLLMNIPTTALIMKAGGMDENTPMINMPASFNIKSIAGGGKAFNEKLMVEENDTVTSYDGKSPVPANEQDPLTYATIGVKAIMGRMTIFDYQDAKIQSPEALVNWLEVNKNQLNTTIRKVVGRNLWGDGTYNSSLDWDGIKAFITATGTNAYGGITPSDLDDATKWSNQVGATVANFSTTSEGLFAMHDLFAKIRHYSGLDPDLIVTDFEKGWPGYVRSAQGTLPFYGQATMAATVATSKYLTDLGIRHLSYNGIPIVEDANITTGAMYFLNTKTIKFKCLRKGNFEFKPPTRGFTYPAETVLFELFGNIICNNRRANGYLPITAV